MDEIDFTIFAATSVLGDLVEKCPPAQACKEAFERMSKATVSMCLASNSDPIGIPRSLGGMGISNDPRHDCETRWHNGGRSAYLPGGSGIQMSQRNGVLKDPVPFNNNPMLLQQQYDQMCHQQQVQRSYAQEDQHWQLQIQNQQHQQLHQQQQQQQQQQQSRRTNSVRAAAMPDIGFNSIPQFNQGVQMSESSYRSTQQPSVSRQTQQSMGYGSLEGSKSAEGSRQLIVTAALQSSPPLLTSPLHPPLVMEQQSQQIHLQQKPQRHQREQNHVSGHLIPSTCVCFTSPVDNETMIDPALQGDEGDSLSIKPSPSPEGIMQPSPPLMDIFEIWGEDCGELEGNYDGGMGMSMGTGMGQVGIFDSFYFGGGGAGGN